MTSKRKKRKRRRKRKSGPSTRAKMMILPRR